IDDEAYSRGWIQPYDQLIRDRFSTAMASEPQAGHLPEDQSHLGLGDRKELAGTDQEGHTRPALVLDFESQRGVGLGRRAGPYTGNGEIALVLTARVMSRVRFGDRTQDRLLGGVERVRVGRSRRLHRSDCQQLKEMVDNHVAECTDRVVEMAPILDPEAFRERDLHRLDVIAVPDR